MSPQIKSNGSQVNNLRKRRLFVLGLILDWFILNIKTRLLYENFRIKIWNVLVIQFSFQKDVGKQAGQPSFVFLKMSFELRWSDQRKVRPSLVLLFHQYSLVLVKNAIRFHLLISCKASTLNVARLSGVSWGWCTFKHFCCVSHMLKTSCPLKRLSNM